PATAPAKSLKVRAKAATASHPVLTRKETPEQAAAASAGCVSCHVGIEHQNMHAEDTVVLGCTDCHGGNASIEVAGTKGSPEYKAAENKAHILSRFAADQAQGGHPVRAYTHWLKESYEYI